MDRSERSAYYSLVTIFIASISAIAFFIDRSQSFVLGIAYFSAFFSYFWVVKFHSSEKLLLPIGILVRLFFFLSLPNLSDDVFRFIWDGRLLANGMDPYSNIPQFYVNRGNEVNGLSLSLFEKLNSPLYYSVYPPLNQLIFWISSFGGESLLFSTNIIRAFILAAEIASFFLLKKILMQHQKSEQLAFWFFLNPLVLLEFTGNLHFEAIVIFFLLLGFYLLGKNKNISSGAVLGGAIATKLLPLIFLPAILFKWKWKKGFIISLISFTVAVLTFLPLISSDLLTNIQKSLGLYFQSFEFNASIYFLIREIGFYIKGYNIIGVLGPALSVGTIVSIMIISIYGSIKKWKIEKTTLVILSVYLFFSTTVHPWYILTLIPIGLLSGYYFPVFWSLIVFVTYFGYNKTGFELSGSWIVFEYASLFLFICIELLYRKHEPIH
ncbi:MAG: DUF2029 domain-containing protein [Cyclobacteriaceae bacterium]